MDDELLRHKIGEIFDEYLIFGIIDGEGYVMTGADPNLLADLLTAALMNEPQITQAMRDTIVAVEKHQASRN